LETRVGSQSPVQLVKAKVSVLPVPGSRWAAAGSPASPIPATSTTANNSGNTRLSHRFLMLHLLLSWSVLPKPLPRVAAGVARPAGAGFPELRSSRRPSPAPAPRLGHPVQDHGDDD